MLFSLFVILTFLLSKKALTDEMDHSLKNDYAMLPLSLDNIKTWITETQGQIEYKREIKEKSTREADSNRDTTG